VAVTFVLLGLIGLFLSYAYTILPGEARDLLLQGSIKGLPDAEAGTSSELTQFSPNMRFGSSDLSYSFIGGCSLDKMARMEGAFFMLENSTKILQFNEVSSNNADILIGCAAGQENFGEGVFIKGEGGPSKFLNLSLYPLIIQGEIMLYEDRYNKRVQECDGPLVELHELLHVFGYAHVDNKSSILYPYLSCEQEMDNEFVEDLVRLYSIEALPEIYFKAVSAEKRGIYLDFNISLANEGLLDSTDIDLEIWSGSKKQGSFELGALVVGGVSNFSVENFKLSSRNLNEIEFKIVESGEEYDLENNIIRLKLE